MTDRTGQQLGNYLLTRPLGQGGFAEVYLGQHIYLKTQAAIKVLLTQLSGDDMEEFLTEARTIANLIHPNIVRVLEFGIEGKTPFLVMDYAPNGTLRQRHPKGSRLEPSIIVPYIKQIAAGLQYAHDQKLIHRDIKPENLLVGRHNEILLSDFGIALVAQSSRYQSTQDVVGTVAYMSPEQIQGKPRPASDLYSLGIVVYEWLTGNRPFHGSFTELCTQHMFAPPPPLRERVPSISTEIEEVVNTALAKDPKQRFGSVEAFANALEQASKTQRPTIVKPPSSRPLSSSPLPPIEAVIPLPPPPPQSIIAPPPPPSSFAQQQVANRASTPYAYGNPYNYNARPGPPTAKGKVNVWSIDKRRIRAAIIGTALFICLNLLSINLFQAHLFPGYFFINPPIILLVITVFFGEVFGPWVGLFVGGMGYVLSIILGPYYYYYYGLSGITIFALIGFIAGLVLFVTKGHYNNFRTISRASIIGILITIPAGYPHYAPVLFISVLLPILLVSYNAIISRRKRA